MTFDATRGARGSAVVKALATNRKVAGSIPDGVNFLNLTTPSGRTRPWGSLSF
jgi:hypothetical protein